MHVSSKQLKKQTYHNQVAHLALQFVIIRIGKLVQISSPKKGILGRKGDLEP